VWGRELAPLDLDTTGGPSWKSLPVVFTAAVAPLDEVDVPIDALESVIDHRVVLRSWREQINGRVYMRGRAKVRETIARVGSIRVYTRERITFPLAMRRVDPDGSRFTGRLQGVHIRANGGRNARARVVTR
jgi:hypothetical protein